MWEYIIGLLGLMRAFQGAKVFLIKRKSKGPVSIMKGAEPFFMRAKKTKKAALLLHGFTATPQELRATGRYLQKHGVSCYAPLLPGHGTTPARLSITKYEQWIEAVEEAIDLLADEYEELYLIGNSFGGNLALIHGNHIPSIKGVITLATPMFFHRERLGRYFLLPFLKNIKLYQKKTYRFPDEATKKRIMSTRITYNQIPLRSLSQMLKVVDRSKQAVKTLKPPLLVMETEEDNVAKEGSAEYMLTHTPHKKSKRVLIPKSYHVFIVDKHARTAYKEILQFIREN